MTSYPSATAASKGNDNAIGRLAADVAHLILTAGLGLENSVRALGIAAKTVSGLTSTSQPLPSAEALAEIFGEGYVALVLQAGHDRSYPTAETRNSHSTLTERAPYGKGK